AGGKCDRDVPRVDQLAQAARNELEQSREVELADERIADLVQRLELPRPRRRRFVEARVLDGDRGLAREQRDDLFVLVGEVRAVVLLGQLQVPVRDAAERER